jgi:hypothetical protein
MAVLCSAAMAANSWMTLPRRVLSQARQIWFGAMSSMVTWTTSARE